ncbi:type II secretion system F family protein [Nocardioides mesophilus]|uniref:Type II secretion system F family protein n=1 Tax=Nocardioides mesophilus TaxID=433659 RepID=A0A7G9RGE4_9ACTN|nr:type II secretion system F family protein [Nocardioides mesophilus]QNN54669.1 type II secretion system F family protein [Nocardioides mesophilus]
MSAGAAALVGVLAGTALLLGSGPGRVRLPRPAGARRSSTGAHRAAGVAVLSSVAAGLVLFLDGTTLALAVIVLLCSVAAALTWRRGREQVRCRQRRAKVVEVSEALVGELRAGQPVIGALDRCCGVWPPFATVAAAARLGADVPAAMRRAAELPGAEGLGRLASAWQVSQRTGCPLAGVVDQVAVSARAELAAARLVRAELASAQATARLVALLPLGTLAMSAGIGGDPWGFLLGHPVGLSCLAAGTALVFAGLWWIDRIAASVTRP